MKVLEISASWGDLWAGDGAEEAIWPQLHVCHSEPRTLSRVTCPRHANMSQQPPPCHAVKTVFRHLQCFLRQLVFFLVSKTWCPPGVPQVSPWCHHCTDATLVSSPWHKRSVSSGYHCHELVKLYIHSTDINLNLYMHQVPCLGVFNLSRSSRVAY